MKGLLSVSKYKFLLSILDRCENIKMKIYCSIFVCNFFCARDMYFGWKNI